MCVGYSNAAYTMRIVLGRIDRKTTDATCARCNLRTPWHPLGNNKPL
jgi:hypothetical protein